MDNTNIINEITRIDNTAMANALMNELMSIELDLIRKDIKKVKRSNSWLFLAVCAAGYGLYFLKEKLDKTNARVVALETEKDILEFEKSIEQTE